MSDNRTNLPEVLRPWCQQAVPAPRRSGDAFWPCGQRFQLRTEERYGTLYNFCPRHQTAHFDEINTDATEKS